MAELFRRQYPLSISIARRILPVQEEFLDAVQSAYLSAFRSFTVQATKTRLFLARRLMRQKLQTTFGPHSPSRIAFPVVMTNRNLKGQSRTQMESHREWQA